MAEHTKEPWTLANNELRSFANGRLLARPSIDGGLIPPPERDANARRIVACVNACAGIPTADLELVGARFPTDRAATLRFLRDVADEAARKPGDR